MAKDSCFDFGNAFKIIGTVSDIDGSNKDKHLLTSRLFHLLSLSQPVPCSNCIYAVCVIHIVYMYVYIYIYIVVYLFAVL